MTSTVPNRIRWSVDLRVDPPLSWSQSRLKKALATLKEGRVLWDIQPASAVSQFLPLYERLIVARDDYRLDPRVVMQRFEHIKDDPAYRVQILHTDDGHILGGTVFRTTDTAIKGGYRAYDHPLASQLGIRHLDYFADYVLQTYGRSQGFHSLSHGIDVHPVTHIGLSIFKFSVGARPYVYDKAEDVPLTSHVPHLYYSDPAADGRYTTLHSIGFHASPLATELAILASRAELRVTAS